MALFLKIRAFNVSWEAKKRGIRRIVNKYKYFSKYINKLVKQ